MLNGCITISGHFDRALQQRLSRRVEAQLSLECVLGWKESVTQDAQKG